MNNFNVGDRVFNIDQVEADNGLVIMAGEIDKARKEQAQERKMK